MTLLPIVARELRVASRKGMTYWSRLSLPLLLMIFVGIGLYSGARVLPREMGRNLFLLAAWVCFVFCTLAGLRAAGDCISSEKREGTLGLLFLTDLKGRDVILGKLLAVSANTISALVGVLPVLCIPLLLGGVSFLTFTKVALTLATTLLLSLSLAILFSTCGKHERTGAGLTFLAMLVLCVFSLGAYALLNDRYPETPWWVDFFRLINPGWTCFLAAQEVPIKSVGTWEWGKAFGCQWAILSAALALASRLAPRVWQEKTTAPRLLLRRWLNWCAYGPAPYRLKARHRWLEVSPVTWLASRNWLKLYGGWAFFGIVVAAWIYLRIRIGREAYDMGVAIWFMAILFMGAKMGMVSEAGLVFSRDIRSGAMELVLTTSMTVEEILRGQLQALTQQFFKPAIAILAFNLFLLVTALVFGEVAQNERWLTVLALVAASVVFVADLYTLAWAGMWAGISTKNANAAIGQSMGRVLFIPWIIVYFLMAAISISTYFLRVDWHPGFPLFLGIWFVSSVANDCLWWQHSRKHLLSEFRPMALQRYDPERKHHFWIALGRELGRLLRKG
jgi:ABC-type transport system involved in cytochrome c biogenesis permease component